MAEFVHLHPAMGASILQRVLPAEVVECAGAHHEQPDGKGYPAGCAGRESPEGARLLAVCDAFDAMTSNRPYRRALPAARALGEIERCAGTQFDPGIASAFLEAFSAGALSDAVAI